MDLWIGPKMWQPVPLMFISERKLQLRDDWFNLSRSIYVKIKDAHSQLTHYTLHEQRWPILLVLLFPKTNYTRYLRDSNSTPNWVLNEMSLMISVQPPDSGAANPCHEIWQDRIRYNEVYLGATQGGDKATCMQFPCPNHRGCCWVSGRRCFSHTLETSSCSTVLCDKFAFPEASSPGKWIIIQK